MPPLKSLENEFPVINSDFRQFCASHGIFSVEDFLVHDVYVLVAHAERHSTSNELKQGITRILSIIDRQHQPWLNGMQLLEDVCQNKHVLSIGCEGIDSLLRGGLREGQVTELVGPSSSGKTQVCQQAAANVAHKYWGSVMYLDTSNSFSPKRVASFISRLLDTPPKQDESLERAMSSIFCHSVFDIFGLLDELYQLKLRLASQMVNGESKLRLLIVDAFSSLITPILGGSSSQGHALMISAGFFLKKLAHEHNLSVLVTNHTVGAEGGFSKPALGESWKSVPHVRLLLSRDQGSNMCSVSILKHPCMASGRLSKFLIED